MPERSVDLDACPQRVKVRLRVAMAAVTEATGRLDLPGTLQARTAGEVTSLWLGPDQWLLTSDAVPADELVALCSRALGSLRHHAVDVSAAFGCASVRGTNARALLAMGSGADWSANWQCARTRFASIPIVAHAHAENVFELYYDRSYRHYLDRWFAHALTDPLVAEQSCGRG
jgi:sarcosine oxidase subunit gamma